MMRPAYIGCPFQWKDRCRREVHQRLIVEVASEAGSCHVSGHGFEAADSDRAYPTALASGVILHDKQLVVQRPTITSYFQFLVSRRVCMRIWLQGHNVVTMMSADFCARFVVLPA